MTAVGRVFWFVVSLVFTVGWFCVWVYLLNSLRSGPTYNKEGPKDAV